MDATLALWQAVDAMAAREIEIHTMATNWRGRVHSGGGS